MVKIPTFKEYILTENFNKDVRMMIVKNHGKIILFKNLPLPAQLALIHYMAVDGEAWEYVESNNIKRKLSFYIKKYGNIKFGYVNIPIEELTKAIIKIEKDIDSHTFKDFKSYHNWYVDSQEMPNHRISHLWPVILSNFNDEILQDGWHRLNDYYRKGVKMIPAVYFP